MKHLLYILLYASITSCSIKVENPIIVNTTPDIFPDYVGVTAPSTIAPLNFIPSGKYKAIYVRAEGEVQGAIEFTSSGIAAFPSAKWKKLLADNTGSAVNISLSIKTEENIWLQYTPFPIYISSNPIDYGIAYRLIAPGYEVYGKMGIYERDLSSFKQRTIMENTLIPGSCINCHSFNQTRTDSMSLHVRGSFAGTIIKGGKKLKAIDTRTENSLAACVYPYWHPTGRYIAYSVNKTRQGFHSTKEELIEVLDLASDIVIYDVETNELFTDTILSSPSLETYPSFSPDGLTLYFCQASASSSPSDYRNIRYNLCSTSFDPSTRRFGSRIDTLINAEAENFSVSFPKPSFDGRYIMYTKLNYGNFGIWHEEADLHLYDITNRSHRAVSEVNSPRSESYHNWSSNSRWFIFGSRRINGLYTRPYIASIDSDGKIGKAFLLPMRNPNEYRSSLYSYNVPEFIGSPIEMDVSMAEEILKGGEREKVGG